MSRRYPTVPDSAWFHQACWLLLVPGLLTHPPEQQHRSSDGDCSSASGAGVGTSTETCTAPSNAWQKATPCWCKIYSGLGRRLVVSVSLSARCRGLRCSKMGAVASSRPLSFAFSPATKCCLVSFDARIFSFSDLRRSNSLQSCLRSLSSYANRFSITLCLSLLSTAVRSAGADLKKAFSGTCGTRVDTISGQGGVSEWGGAHQVELVVQGFDVATASDLLQVVVLLILQAHEFHVLLVDEFLLVGGGHLGVVGPVLRREVGRLQLHELHQPSFNPSGIITAPNLIGFAHEMLHHRPDLLQRLIDGPQLRPTPFTTSCGLGCAHNVERSAGQRLEQLSRAKHSGLVVGALYPAASG